MKNTLFTETWKQKEKRRKELGSKNGKYPMKSELVDNDFRFHNWRVFWEKGQQLGVFANKCNTCCRKCEHQEDCYSACDWYTDTVIKGTLFICDNCKFDE